LDVDRFIDPVDLRFSISVVRLDCGVGRVGRSIGVWLIVGKVVCGSCVVGPVVKRSVVVVSVCVVVDLVGLWLVVGHV
jgi:hypothetical protein